MLSGHKIRQVVSKPCKDTVSQEKMGIVVVRVWK